MVGDYGRGSTPAVGGDYGRGSAPAVGGDYGIEEELEFSRHSTPSVHAETFPSTQFQVRYIITKMLKLESDLSNILFSLDCVRGCRGLI